ncbi:IS66 family insertion sequence element accessory protein TnpB [Pseudomonas sp. Hz4]
MAMMLPGQVQRKCLVSSNANGWSSPCNFPPMIRVDAIWLATEPLDMRAGTETALARVVAVFGEAKSHYAYLFANRGANRMKVLVHDGSATQQSPWPQPANTPDRAAAA